MSSTATATARPRPEHDERLGPVARLRVALGGIGAAILGAAPHILHHAGPLAGAALFAGIGGQLVFGALGLLLAIPMLRKLRRHTGSWAAPLGALTLFSVVFLISTFVVGPALTGDRADSAKDDTPARQAPGPAGHDEHH